MSRPDVVELRTRLRQLCDACDMGTVRFLEVGYDIRSAVRTLGRIDAAWPEAEGDADLPSLLILAGLREVRDQLEALVIAERDPLTASNLGSATFDVARAIVLLVKQIAVDERQRAAAWADWRRRGGQ